MTFPPYKEEPHGKVSLIKKILDRLILHGKIGT